MEDTVMARLTTEKREALGANQFAYVDRSGEEHLPINDAAHVRNAIARFDQTEFESKAAKERARKKIVSAAHHFDIEVGGNADVAHPVRSLRATSTKAGPRGGRRH
jgi:hypothetical protein